MSSNPRDLAFWQKRRAHINALTGEAMSHPVHHPQRQAPPGVRVDARTFGEPPYPPIVPVDPLNRMSNAAAQVLGSASMNQQAGDALIPTYRPLAGATANNRGQAVRLAAGSVNGTLQDPKNVTVVQTPTLTGDDAEIFTVVCGIEEVSFIPTPPNQVCRADVFGTLVWGIGGASFEADFDWLNGAQIQVAASFVRVLVTYNTYNVVQGEFQPVIVNAGLAYHGLTRSNNRGAQRTQQVHIGAAGGSTGNLDIPAFATGFSIVGVVGGGGGGLPNLVATIRRRGSPSPHPAAAEFAITTYEDQQSTFPVFNGADVINVANKDAVNDFDGFIVWSLAF